MLTMVCDDVRIYGPFNAVFCRWSGDCWSAWRCIICSCWQKRIKEKRKQDWPRNRGCPREERSIFPYLPSASTLFLSFCLFCVFLYFYSIINSKLDAKINLFVLFCFLKHFKMFVTVEYSLFAGISYSWISWVIPIHRNLRPKMLNKVIKYLALLCN